MPAIWSPVDHTAGTPVAPDMANGGVISVMPLLGYDAGAAVHVVVFSTVGHPLSSIRRAVRASAVVG
jgi:hypothetical protein